MSLEFGILGFLSDNNLTGYEIKKAYDIAAGFVWPANQGQIYRTLSSMLQKGWVSIVETSPGILHDKKTYCITETGRTELQNWLVSGLNESPIRNEALLKLFHYANAEPEIALNKLNQFIAQKKMITAVFDKMTIERADEYRNMLNFNENSPEFRLNLFISKWGYMREKAFLEFLELYKEEFIKILETRGVNK